ncbi:MAG: SPFH domain-containing protein [Alphaproteobacteria bacterium]|nr:SPFH domain-containing protein [Alphaproteobacteria bacterium SS10]
MTKQSIDDVQEFKAFGINGFFMLAVFIAIAGLAALGMTVRPFSGIMLGIIAFLIMTGFTVVQPNEAKAIVFFGKYKGSIRTPGFQWTWPLSARQRVSMRLINFDSEKLKVNDVRGNPVEIGAIVVWRVVDSAKAVFNVDDYTEFVHTQSETALRNVAAKYPYDGSDDETTLRGSSDEVAADLIEQLQGRLEIAGVVLEETRLSHLAYAPEIAAAMLRRQQAEAVIAARRFIVENAVGMVDDVLGHFGDSGTVNLDDDRKATLIGNLMVALVSDRDAEPVIRVG